jgi:hypothetical protein
MMLLGRTPLEWQPIDISQIPGYQGEIPMLETEEGKQIIGLGAITQYIRSMGFR